MRFTPRLVPAVFVRRPNRFVAVVRRGGQDVLVHVANTGRMRELLVAGNEVYLSPAPGVGRKTAYDLKLARITGALVCTDARLPPLLVREAVQRGRTASFTGSQIVRHEPAFGHGRFDLLLQEGSRLCYVETKCVTLVERGCGLFPDAPTERGRRHLDSLTDAVRAGRRGAVVFVIQREDATTFSPHERMDPLFAEALRRAAVSGVEVYAYRCRVTPRQIAIASSVPVRL
ncbi:MAG: DNA/RNA nuclease SfsA [Chloroflexi bacterium]|nr:DNA/RNA nuclease SfsA [Chloroflexota bacterium]